jgi:hypothetical protein
MGSQGFLPPARPHQARPHQIAVFTLPPLLAPAAPIATRPGVLGATPIRATRKY